MKRPKKSSLRKLKAELEKLQKQIVLAKYGRDCYTCGAKDLQGKNCHLGHVPWPRSILSVECKYDTRFTRAQCMVCNVHRGGMGAVALQRMRDEGIDVDAMRALNEATKGKPVPSQWFQEKLSDYLSQLSMPIP